MVTCDLRESKIFSFLSVPNLKDYQVIASPEGEDEGFWAGGCSSLRDKEGKIWLAYRLRNPEKRGHKVCIAVSTDGFRFQVLKNLSKDDFDGIISLERPSLLQDPFTGKYRLYLSAEKEGKWYIYKLEDTHSPENFDPSTAKIVFSPSIENKDSRKVKDPYIFNFLNTWFMFYSGSGPEPQEEVYLAISQDGTRWIRMGRVLSRSYWHDYHTRMSCLMPVKKGFLCLYEGSSTGWYEPHFNLNIGIGFTLNLKNILDLTITEPLLFSSTGKKFSTVRYVDYVVLNNKILFYYEAARKDGSFELRVTQLVL